MSDVPQVYGAAPRDGLLKVQIFLNQKTCHGVENNFFLVSFFLHPSSCVYAYMNCFVVSVTCTCTPCLVYLVVSLVCVSLCLTTFVVQALGKKIDWFNVAVVDCLYVADEMFLRSCVEIHNSNKKKSLHIPLRGSWGKKKIVKGDL